MATAQLGVRATSLAASAALLGAATIAAMTMTFSMMLEDAPPDSVPVVELRAEPEPPPPREPEASRAVSDNAIEVADAPWSPLQDASLPADPFAFAGFAEPGPALITDPHWRRRPSDLGRYYPAQAVRRNVEGNVLLDCMVSASGWLNACRIIEETPREWGFGAAALRIAADHQMAPAMRDGVPVEGRYSMRVPFQLQ